MEITHRTRAVPMKSPSTYTEVCDGGSWSGKKFAVLAPPDLGDDSLAGLIWETGNRSPLEEWIVVIRHGDVLAEFTLVEKVAEEVAEDDYLRFQNGRVIDAEFHAIISAALDKLPD